MWSQVQTPREVPGPDFTVSSVALFIGTPSPGKVLYIGTEKGCISIAVMIILLTLSCDILRLWRDAAEFQHHGQRESSRWKARSLSMVLDRARQQQSAAEPPDICTRWHVYISPITWISPRQSTHIFFSIHVSVCEDYILLRPTRSNKKKKRKQAIIAMVCNTIHGTVKEAWEVNRIGCGGDCSPHVEKKNLKAFQVIVCSCISIQRRIQFDLRN